MLRDRTWSKVFHKAMQAVIDLGREKEQNYHNVSFYELFEEDIVRVKNDHN